MVARLLLCSCWGVGRLLIVCSGSLQTFPLLVITENQTLFSKLIQVQCCDIIVFLSNVRKFKSVTLNLALKRDLYHLNSQCKITRITRTYKPRNIT